MPDRDLGIRVFLCEACRAKSPMVIRNQHQWRCPHNRLTIVERNGSRYLRYDRDLAAPVEPRFDNTGTGPFRIRTVGWW